MHKKKGDEASMTENEVMRLAEMLRGARRAVFFGGAGVSTESCIPDFRSTDGLYHQQWRYPPETILSHDFFEDRTEEFYDFYRQKMLFPQARPNPAHEALAELERRGILSAVITQNIDGLHQAAGRRNVIELHGSVLRNHCVRCHRSYSLDEILQSQGVPRCPCGGVIKPDVVLYEEPLDEACTRGAVKAIAAADALIVAGTSLTVYPAAGFLNYFRGKHLVLINRDATPYDDMATLALHEKVGEVLGQIVV